MPSSTNTYMYAMVYVLQEWTLFLLCFCLLVFSRWLFEECIWAESIWEIFQIPDERKWLGALQAAATNFSAALATPNFGVRNSKGLLNVCSRGEGISMSRCQRALASPSSTNFLQLQLKARWYPWFLRTGLIHCPFVGDYRCQPSHCTD